MKINIYNRQKKMPIAVPAVRKVIKAILAKENQNCDEVSIHFVTTKEISELHGKYFNDPSTTDCISFPMDDLQDEMKYRILGEVFVCPETAVVYAQKHKKDPFEECLLYIIHGILHLLGYDDLEPRKKASMRRAEKRHLLNLKKLKLMLK